jgi:hypothetical protein
MLSAASPVVKCSLYYVYLPISSVPLSPKVLRTSAPLPLCPCRVTRELGARVFAEAGRVALGTPHTFAMRCPGVSHGEAVC